LSLAVNRDLEEVNLKVELFLQEQYEKGFPVYRSPLTELEHPPRIGTSEVTFSSQKNEAPLLQSFSESDCQSRR
jgi:hypothetical protein